MTIPRCVSLDWHCSAHSDDVLVPQSAVADALSSLARLRLSPVSFDKVPFPSTPWSLNPSSNQAQQWSSLNPSSNPSSNQARLSLRLASQGKQMLCLQSLNRPLARLAVPTPRSTSSRPMLAFNPRRETNRLPAWLASLVVRTYRTYRLPAWLGSLVVPTNTCDIYAKKHLAPRYRSCI